MNQKTINQPEIEQNFLTRNALLSIALGCVFFFDVAYELLAQSSWSDSWMSKVLGAFMTIAFLVMLAMMLKVISTSGKLKKQGFWYGAYQDEFMSFVNKKGYQYSHNFMYLVFISALVINGWLPDMSNLISVDQYTKFGIAALAFSYGLPVIYLLKKESD